MIEIKTINAKETYEIRHKVLWPSKPIAFIKVDDDLLAVHFGLFTDGICVSVVSVFDQGASLQFRKFATLESEQGKGYGTKLLGHVFEYAQAEGYQRIWCNARQTKSEFYKRFGMSESEAGTSKEGIAYVIMEKEL